MLSFLRKRKANLSRRLTHRDLLNENISSLFDVRPKPQPLTSPNPNQANRNSGQKVERTDSPEFKNITFDVPDSPLKKPKVLKVSANKAIFTVGKRQKVFCKESLYCLNEKSQIRKWAIRITSHSFFTILMYSCAFLEFLLIVGMDYNKQNSTSKYHLEFFRFFSDSKMTLILFIEVLFFIELVLMGVSRGFFADNQSFLRKFNGIFSALSLLCFSLSFLSGIIAFSSIRLFRFCKLPKKLGMNFFEELEQMIKLLKATIIEILILFCLLSGLIFLFSIIAVNLWAGILDYRCRFTETPVDGDWPVDENWERLCGSTSYPCPSGEFCGSNFDFVEMFPDSFDLDAVRQEVMGFYSFKNIFNASITNFTIVLVDNWFFLNNKIREAYGSMLVTTLYFIVLIFMSSFFLNNFVVAVLLDNLTKKEMEKDKKSVLYFALKSPASFAPKKLSFAEPLSRDGTGESSNQKLRSIRAFLRKLFKGVCFKRVPFPDDSYFAEADWSVVVCFMIINQPIFNFIVYILILANMVALSLDPYPPYSDTLSTGIYWINLAVTAFFCIEALIKYHGLGFNKFIDDKFNLYEALVAILGVIDLIVFGISSAALSVLRSFRLFKIVFMLKELENMRVLVGTLILTIKLFLNYSVLYVTFILAAAAIGKNTFSNQDESLVAFDSFGLSITSVLQIVTSENYSEIVFICMKKVGFGSFFYFIGVACIGRYILGNIFLAMLLLIFEKSRTKKQKELLKISGIISRFKRKVAPDVFLSLCNKEVEELAENPPLKIPENSPVQDNIPPPTDSLSKPARAEMGNTEGDEVLESRTDRQSTEQDHILSNEKSQKGEDNQFAPASFRSEIQRQESSEVRNPSKQSSSSNLGNKMESTILIRNSSLKVDISFEGEFLASSSYFPRKTSIVARSFIKRAIFHFKISSLGLFEQKSITRNFFIKIVEHRYWEWFIIFLILLTCCVLALDDPLGDPNSLRIRVITIFDNVFTFLFLIEFIMNIFAYGVFFNANPSKKAYLRSKWNILDSIVLLASFIDFFETGGSGLQSVKSLRALRALRPLKVVRRNESMRLSVSALFSSIPPLFSLVVTCFIVLMVGSIICMKFFKGSFYSCDIADPDLLDSVRTMNDCLELGGEWTNANKNFDNVFRSLLSLIEMSTGEAWVDLNQSALDSVGLQMQPASNNRPWGSFIVISSMLFGTIILFNLFTGVAVDNFKMKKKELSGLSGLDEEQKLWAETQKIFQRKKLKVCIAPPNDGLRLFAFKVVSSNYFEYFIMICIILNVLVMACTYVNNPELLEKAIGILNNIFLGIFHAEAALRIMAYGFIYFKDNFNRFDLSIVVLSDIFLTVSFFTTSTRSDFDTLPTVMRALRIGKLIRIVRFSKYIQLLLDTMFLLFSSTLNIVALFLLLTFIFAILGLSFFPYVQPIEYINDFQNFQNIQNSMVTLFQCATGENWDLIMEELAFSAEGCLDEQNYEDIVENGIKGCGTFIAYPFFMVFLILVRMIVINLILAIIIEGYTDFRKEDDAVISPIQVEEIIDKWAEYDKSGSGFVKPEEFLFILFEIHPPAGLKKDNPIRFEANFLSNPRYLVSQSKKVILKKNSKFFRTLSKFNVKLFWHKGEWLVHFSEAIAKISRRAVKKVHLSEKVDDLPKEITKLLHQGWSDAFPSLKQVANEERKYIKDVLKKLNELKKTKMIQEAQAQAILSQKPCLADYFAKKSIVSIIKSKKEKAKSKKSHHKDEEMLKSIKGTYSTSLPILQMPEDFEANLRKWKERKKEGLNKTKGKERGSLRFENNESSKLNARNQEMNDLKTQNMLLFQGAVPVELSHAKRGMVNSSDIEGLMRKIKRKAVVDEIPPATGFSSSQNKSKTSKMSPLGKQINKENQQESTTKHWFDDENITIAQQPSIKYKVLSNIGEIDDLLFGQDSESSKRKSRASSDRIISIQSFDSKEKDSKRDIPVFTFGLGENSQDEIELVPESPDSKRRANSIIKMRKMENKTSIFSPMRSQKEKEEERSNEKQMKEKNSNTSSHLSS